MEWKELHSIENLDTVELTDDQDFYLSVVSSIEDNENFISILNIPKNANTTEDFDVDEVKAKCFEMSEKLDCPSKLAEYIQERVSAPETQLVEVTLGSLKGVESFKDSKTQLTDKQWFCISLANSLNYTRFYMTLLKDGNTDVMTLRGCNSTAELADYFYNKQKDT